MRVILATIGTRGDVQPMLALACALVQRGHRVTLACPANFAEWVRASGVEHQELGEDLQRLMLERGDKFARSVVAMKQYFREQLLRQAPALLSIAQGADVLVGTGMAWTSPSVAEKLGIPALQLYPTSCARSKLHPPPLIPVYGLPRWLNAVLWWVSDAIQNRLMRGPLNEARAGLGLAPVAAFSEHLFIDTPGVIAADDVFLPPDPAWNGRYPYAGYLFLDDPAPLDPELDTWLSAGPPPLCVGFGSMAGRHTQRAERAVEEAVPKSGRRWLVLAGSAGLFSKRETLPEGVFVSRGAPHQKLFPRVAAVVHHGGAGTTAAALRSGVPQVVLPMILDQFHHAHHLVRAGLMARSPRMAAVTGASLSRAIQSTLALPEEPRRRMAERLQRSDAGGHMVDRLEAMAARR